MPSARLCAVVVTHDSAREIDACLNSLRRSSRPPDEIVVVDNASRDGTPDRVRRAYPDVLVLDYWDNPGFGEAHNRAFRVVSAQRAFLLNPDATVERDCIERLERTLDGEPGLGVAVPKVLLAREPAVLNSAGLHVNGIGYGWDRGYLEWDAGQHDRAGPVLAGSGCALMLSLAMVRAVGGFDPSFFLYYEDLDLCLRSWLAGFGVRFVPEAVALHRMKLSGRSAWLDDYVDHRNRLRTVVKCFPAPLLGRALVRSAGYDLASIAGALRRGAVLPALRRVAAWGWNFLHLRDTWRRRHAARPPQADDAWTTLLTAGSGAPRLQAAQPRYTPAHADVLESLALGPALVMGVDETGLGLGWHALETERGVPHRWCCGYGIAFLRTPRSGPGVLRIACRALRPSAVRVVVDRAWRGELRVEPGPFSEQMLAVRGEGAVVRIEIFPEPVVVPAETEPGGTDTRPLGLAVRSLRWEAS